MDKKTIETYDLLAKEYDEETTDFWERFPREFIDLFAERVQERGVDEAGGEVLNVGSGPGRDGLLLKDKGLKVTCLDASSTMVELSSARGLTSITGDFLDLPFDENSFDGVWAYTSLLHVPKSEIDRAIVEIQRVLKPGGIFGLGLIEGDTEVYRESAGVGKPRLFTYYSREEVEGLLKKHGFEPFYFDSMKPRSSSYLHFLSRKV